MPAEASPDGPLRRDWVLVGLVLAVSVGEVALRSDVLWRPVALILSVVIAFTLPWRRVRPGWMATCAFGSIIVVQLASILVGPGGPVGLSSGIVVLLVVYATARWGSGNDVVLVVALLIAVFALGAGRDYHSAGEAIPELVVLTLPFVLGLAVRFRAHAVRQQLDEARHAERESLAREMHDTVAHHVSAIVLQAQGGQAAAATNPAAAVAALRVIEGEGTRALSEMRALVGFLRAAGPADTSPIKGISDIEALGDRDGRPVITVSMAGDLEDVHPAVGAALYRIAQESVTNAIRHAVDVRSVDITVVGDATSVRLTVEDDGRSVVGPAPVPGYGIVGMTERVAMLGGTIDVGAGSRGWKVEAMLPRSGRAV